MDVNHVTTSLIRVLEESYELTEGGAEAPNEQSLNLQSPNTDRKLQITIISPNANETPKQAG